MSRPGPPGRESPPDARRFAAQSWAVHRPELRPGGQAAGQAVLPLAAHPTCGSPESPRVQHRSAQARRPAADLSSLVSEERYDSRGADAARVGLTLLPLWRCQWLWAVGSQAHWQSGTAGPWWTSLRVPSQDWPSARLMIAFGNNPGTAARYSSRSARLWTPVCLMARQITAQILWARLSLAGSQASSPLLYRMLATLRLLLLTHDVLLNLLRTGYAPPLLK